MSGDNVAHWRPSHSRRSSFLQLHRLGGVRITGYRATIPCDIHGDFEILKSRVLMKENPGKIEKHYRVKAEGDSEILLDEIGKIYNFLSKGKITDVDRSARFVLKAWQEGKIK